MKKRIFLVILPLALLLALMPLMVSAAGGPWEDDFDSYPTGSPLHGVGGWKGWQNNPAFGASTTDVQARSAPNSVDILGASDLVHEYTASSGQWVYTAWMYIPGNMTGQSYFIMLNQYDDACATCNWSVQTHFNSATGLMTDDGTGATQPYITDQWVEIRLEIDLDADTQAFYYNGALFYTGTWSGHISGGGITAIGAVDLFANNATSVYYDDMSLLPPFVAAPGITVDKSPATQNVTTNGIATFTITVTNTGNVDLANVNVSDPLVPACDNAIGTLAISATVSYGCQDMNVTGSYTNVVTATGVYTGGPATVTDTDSAAVIYTSPTSVSLSGLGGDSTGIPIVFAIATVGVGIAAGIFVLSRRRQQI